MEKPIAIMVVCVATMMILASNCACAQYQTTFTDKIEVRFDKMDTDNDGKVSHAEYIAYHLKVAEAKFAWIDVNGDGFATRNEHKEGVSEIVGEAGHMKKGTNY